MNTFPISLRIANHRCLVVGGGDIAARKVELLLRANAVVSVVAPELCPSLEELRRLGSISHLPRTFENHDVPGNFLVIAATNDLTTNRRVSEVSESNNIPVNVVDQPELCTFTMPSIVDRSPVTIAVSTGGASPVMAGQVRARPT